MTKEEYKKKEAEIDEKIGRLRDELKDVKDEYIRTNVTIPTGTKVRIVGKDTIGVLVGYELKGDCIKPIVAKMNKDGSPHTTARIFIWFDTKIEPVE